MTSNPWRRTGRPLMIAHAGHTIAYPDNTMVAFERAIELGAEMIEADVNITRDGELAMIHDWTLRRTTGRPGRTCDVTMAELQSLDAGSWFDPQFGECRVPSTKATLELAREAGILMCFEVKGADESEAKRIAKALVELIVAHDAVGWAFMSSYWHEAMALGRTMVPDLMLAPERLPDNIPADPSEAARQARALRAEVIQNHHDFLEPELIEALHHDDVAIWAWPTTTEEELVKSIGLGVDGVMGDDIGLMVEVVDRLASVASPD